MWHDNPDDGSEPSLSPIFQVARVWRESTFSQPSAWAPRPDLYQTPGCDPSEVEVLDLLWALVRAYKPSLILETGTSIGYGALVMAKACQANGFGRVISLEINPDIAAIARDMLEREGHHGAGVGCAYVEVANSMEYTPPEPVAMLFSDSDLNLRVAELQRFHSMMCEPKLVAMHDTLKHRASIPGIDSLAWEQCIHAPTPRGLTFGRLRG